MDCDNCEKPKVCPEDCGTYQDLDYEVKHYKALAEQWKLLATMRYTKMVDARLRVKELEGE